MLLLIDPPIEESIPHPILASQDSDTIIPQQEQEVIYENIGRQLQQKPRKSSGPPQQMDRSESSGHRPQVSNSPNPRVRTPQGERRDATVKPPPPMTPAKPSKPTSNQAKRFSSYDISSGNKSPKVPLLPPARGIATCMHSLYIFSL